MEKSTRIEQWIRSTSSSKEVEYYDYNTDNEGYIKYSIEVANDEYNDELIEEDAINEQESKVKSKLKKWNTGGYDTDEMEDGMEDIMDLEEMNKIKNETKCFKEFEKDFNLFNRREDKIEDLIPQFEEMSLRQNNYYTWSTNITPPIQVLPEDSKRAWNELKKPFEKETPIKKNVLWDKDMLLNTDTFTI